MKTIKYTAVALALIAAASFTSTAKAASNGDILLGIYDSNTSGTGYVASDYVVDLGSFTSLTQNESFSLGSAINTLFGSDTTATLQFDIVGAGTALSNNSGGLAKNKIAFTDTASLAPFSGSNTSPVTDIGNAITGLGQVSSSTSTVVTTGTNFTAYTQPISGFNDSFVNQSGDLTVTPGFGTGQTLYTAYSTSASAAFYTLASGSTSPTADPKGFAGGDNFTFSGTAGNVTLTFDPTATPEPSAYALGLCAAALFWVLNRRRSVA